MEMIYCSNCKKVTGHKRAVGMGTLLGAVSTLGLSLGAVPFYPKRCVVCGATNQNSDTPSVASKIEYLINEGSLSKAGIAVKLSLSESVIDSECLDLFRSGRIGRENAERILGRPPVEQGLGESSVKKCPFCAEDIKIEAIKCKHCGSLLSANPRDLRLHEQIRNMVVDGHKALKISIHAKISQEKAVREIVKLYQTEEITETECETALGRELTKDELVGNQSD